MEQIRSQLNIKTPGEGFTDITLEVNKWLKKAKIISGILLIFSKHTSCSLIINENADPNVLRDLHNYMNGIVPKNKYRSIDINNNIVEYHHQDEGEDDMPAHIRTMLTSTSLNVSVENSELVLGTWQAIYLWEHRKFSKSRQLHLHLIGDFN